MARASYAVRIRARIAELESVIKAAEIELSDLRIAERVIESLGPDDDEYDAPASARHTKGKTVSDLIADVLTEFGPMDSREVFDRVSKRQETTFNTISTTLSRMKDQGIVVLQGKTWGLINKDNILDDPALTPPTDDEAFAEWEEMVEAAKEKTAAP